MNFLDHKRHKKHLLISAVAGFLKKIQFSGQNFAANTRKSLKETELNKVNKKCFNINILCSYANALYDNFKLLCLEFE